MKTQNGHTDRYLLILLLMIMVGLPLGIRAYDHAVWAAKIPAGAKVFTLTGNTDRGWILGRVTALDTLLDQEAAAPPDRPVIRVAKGDKVVFKIMSSDVVHGFSLKDMGIFLTDGIPPGKVRLVSFVADKVGTFTFSCNAICGKNHEKMQGTLIVTG